MSQPILFWFFVLITIIFAIYLARQRRQVQQRVQQNEENNFLTSESMPPLLLSLDETEQWEILALNLLHDKRELSAVELVQKHTGLNFPEAQIKLYKLEEAEKSA